MIKKGIKKRKMQEFIRMEIYEKLKTRNLTKKK